MPLLGKVASDIAARNRLRTAFVSQSIIQRQIQLGEAIRAGGSIGAISGAELALANTGVTVFSSTELNTILNNIYSGNRLSRPEGVYGTIVVTGTAATGNSVTINLIQSQYSGLDKLATPLQYHIVTYNATTGETVDSIYVNVSEFSNSYYDSNRGVNLNYYVYTFNSIILDTQYYTENYAVNSYGVSKPNVTDVYATGAAAYDYIPSILDNLIVAADGTPGTFSFQIFQPVTDTPIIQYIIETYLASNNSLINTDSSIYGPGSVSPAPTTPTGYNTVTRPYYSFLYTGITNRVNYYIKIKTMYRVGVYSAYYTSANFMTTTVG